MPSIWITEIVFKPTGALTFRQMPSGILHIMSYPFMPPTTMSGFIKRLLDIAEGSEWKGYGKDWFGKGPGNHFTLTLDQNYRALGAFPEQDQWCVHKTRRHGPKNFKHRNFSQILRTDHKENYELHHWDYLFCNSLTGWIAAKEKEPLEKLGCLKNFGGKAGKEGWLFVESISEPRQVFLTEGQYIPLGLVTPPLRPDSGMFYNLYGHYWDENYQWTNNEKGGVTGFTQLGAWWNVDRVSGAYWAWDKGLGFPAHIPDDFIAGKEVEPFYNP
ncbi:Uncharacterized protein dnl_34300 [Desulfonema limicola]|uniref:Uncharacterized protein n=1 Tax=Desulfonema limicola TaxID=45656 RepID=A0A975GHA4_9BACT|nr:hypothetical protein [Desulfonema limicola]QTA81104.1 Uncharacterized protein dnl_34300 [Desulfonema limicola]